MNVNSDVHFWTNIRIRKFPKKYARTAFTNFEIHVFLGYDGDF